MDHESLLRSARVNINNALNDRTARVRDLVTRISNKEPDDYAAIAAVAIEWLEQAIIRVEHLHQENQTWSSSPDRGSQLPPPVPSATS